jgi:hypothetical protein
LCTLLSGSSKQSFVPHHTFDNHPHRDCIILFPTAAISFWLQPPMPQSSGQPAAVHHEERPQAALYQKAERDCWRLQARQQACGHREEIGLFSSYRLEHRPSLQEDWLGTAQATSWKAKASERPRPASTGQDCEEGPFSDPGRDYHQGEREAQQEPVPRHRPKIHGRGRIS